MGPTPHKLTVIQGQTLQTPNTIIFIILVFAYLTLKKTLNPLNSAHEKGGEG